MFSPLVRTDMFMWGKYMICNPKQGRNMWIKIVESLGARVFWKETIGFSSLSNTCIITTKSVVIKPFFLPANSHLPVFQCIKGYTVMMKIN